MEEIKGFEKRDNAVVSTDLEGLTAYKNRRKMYKKLGMIDQLVDRVRNLEAQVADLTRRLGNDR